MKYLHKSTLMWYNRYGDNMNELLAPAGNMTALIAAISNGADAIYLGLNKFGARAYANNFSIEELKDAVNYAHLRNVKIYVTMNTIVYDKELADAYLQIDEIYKAGCDGIIIQDLAIFNYVVNNYPSMEAHTSTQMGIEDLEGTLLFKELGAKRIVLSREVPIEKIELIKKKSKMPIEIFVHGALCVSYSGNCLMSGLIGYRSGNRGRCVGSCRKEYELINKTTSEVFPKSYILSMKDLNTIEHIDKLKIADSLKIEGRMKEPIYVANIIKSYRELLDNKNTDVNQINRNLAKTFNRTFTKGYIFHEDKKDITNIIKPNNFGYKIGYIARKHSKLGYEIKLYNNEELNQGDIIRIDHNGTDVNLTALRIYDNKENLINSSSSTCYISIKEDLTAGDVVYKTKDIKYSLELEKTYPREYRRFPVDLYVYASISYPLTMTLTCQNVSISLESDFIVEKANNNPTTKESFMKQFNRLGNTVYALNEIEFISEDDIFIPANKINELRRQAIILLDEKRNPKRDILTPKEKEYKKIGFDVKESYLTVYANTLEQYNAAKDAGIDVIYYKDNVIRRNEIKYQKTDRELLIGGYGGIYFYKDTNSFISDFSLNCVNFEAVYTLHSLGAKRVTLSYELNKQDIDDIVADYKEKVGLNPSLEMIVYGKADMMFTKYCPLKKMNQCGKCRENKYVIKDDYEEFPIINHDDCTVTILNGKTLNLIDDLETINNIEAFRIVLTTEDYDKSLGIINMFKDKLDNPRKTNLFNKNTDTRGHFNKEIL